MRRYEAIISGVTLSTPDSTGERDPGDPPGFGWAETSLYDGMRPRSAA